MGRLRDRLIFIIRVLILVRSLYWSSPQCRVEIRSSDWLKGMVTSPRLYSSNHNTLWIFGIRTHLHLSKVEQSRCSLQTIIFFNKNAPSFIEGWAITVLFADDYFKNIFFVKIWNLIQICYLKNLTKLASRQIFCCGTSNDIGSKMTWCWPNDGEQKKTKITDTRMRLYGGDKCSVATNLVQFWPRSMSPYGAARLQRVNIVSVSLLRNDNAMRSLADRLEATV